jgi:uncharacterized membrane protein
VTILSVNKTRESDGRIAPIFLRNWAFWEAIMNKKVRFLVNAAVTAAIYVALTHLQNFLLPGSATWLIQFRIAEALCILAYFTPAAIPGLAVGCLLFNITYAGALPLDFAVGSIATALSAGSMWLTRNVKIKGYPLLGMFMPALFNAILVGWELTVYIGGGFWLNAACVAAGELGVLLTLGTLLYYAIKKRHLDTFLR